MMRQRPACRARLLLPALILPLLLAGCGGRERDVLAAQYFPDPIVPSRNAFQPKFAPYAPPFVPPAQQSWPPGPFY
jgi:hypothetical protein